MTVVGTVVNGVIVPDEGAELPEGARVRIELADTADQFAPLAPEAELELLRERVAELRSGAPGVPLDKAIAQIAADGFVGRGRAALRREARRRGFTRETLAWWRV
jgi:hypothetical protein